MDRQPNLEGERLLLRPLVRDDWDALFAVASDKRVWEQHPMHDRWQEPVFREFFDDALAKGGALAIVDRNSDQIIGSSRYQDYAPDDGGSVEIGWTFIAPDHWGSGINAELKRLMLEHAFRYVARVNFRVGESNHRSRKAMEKIGGALTDETYVAQLPDGPAVHVIYAITRESFANGPLANMNG
ncbi:GNAT family N-acetyltransferase [Pontixanthobacter aestiaquae]|uniref:GNAT family N-acetyltransferase n=1 Tax=Pontixanthobacter aestiaquae TaxID=1509367 RepID=A0A844Z7B3_9SPHN|nr:GNAT family N-acetyltransferase [Pontixanthobacter aestiaquae]MDN3646245.1 GNAT family N-acetyltransferase [Pontixanthobacter aestiaquae]MXO82763.1 GNAT family N-acetyltransferase [Pontixanthobacter aestiaquae]